MLPDERLKFIQMKFSIYVTKKSGTMKAIEARATKIEVFGDVKTNKFTNC